MSKRAVILYLREIHNAEHRAELDGTCPFCQRKRENAERMVSMLHEPDLLSIVNKHVTRWENAGVRIANRSNGHQLPSTLVSTVLTQWIALRVDLPDCPEDYYDHPLVIELYERQKNGEYE